MVLSMSFLVLSTAYSAPKEASPRKVQKHSIGLGLGQTFLVGGFNNKGDDKITLDMLYTYTASYSFDLLINLHNSNHSFEEKEVKLRGLTMSIKARSFEFDAFSPYALGGLGFYLPQVITDDGESEEKMTFGLNLGGGLDLRLNDQFIIGVLAQYHLPFNIKQEDPNISTVRGSYLKLLMTLMYQF